MAYYGKSNSHPQADHCPPPPPSALDHKPSSAKNEHRKTTCRTGTRTSVKKPKSTSATKKKVRTLSENCSELYRISDTAEPTVTSRSRRRSRRDIDYLTLNDGLEEDSVESPKRRKASYPPNRRGPSADRVAAQ